MPYTLNGFGTAYYGKRDVAEDNSYVTTLWVAALWIPLFPLASYRVRESGKSTNWLVHRSQSYLAQRVPMCWEQVRNVYFIVAPILLVVLYFSWRSIQQWHKEDVVKSQVVGAGEKTEVPQSRADASPDNGQVLTEQPANNMAVRSGPCGQVLRLNKQAFQRLDLYKQLSRLVDNAGFTAKDLELMPHSDLEQQAFGAYSFAYLLWNKPEATARSDFQKMIQNAVNKVGPPSSEEEETIRKFGDMMLKASELGWYDANRNPCPF